MRWIEQATRIFKKTGTLYVYWFSEILADLNYPMPQVFK